MFNKEDYTPYYHGDDQLTIMSWNIANGRKTINFDKLVEVVSARNHDIVCLQEAFLTDKQKEFLVNGLLKKYGYEKYVESEDTNLLTIFHKSVKFTESNEIFTITNRFGFNIRLQNVHLTTDLYEYEKDLENIDAAEVDIVIGDLNCRFNDGEQNPFQLLRRQALNEHKLKVLYPEENTFKSDVNDNKFILDGALVKNSLLEYIIVQNYVNVGELDNISDHYPIELLMYVPSEVKDGN